MATVIVGNSRTEEMVGDLTALTPTDLRVGGCVAQRLLWFARDGDVLVLPWLPSDDYLAYVTALTGTDRGTLTFVVPPPGRLGTDILTPDRLADESFRDQLRRVLRDRSVRHVFPVYTDLSVVELAHALGVEAALPGHRFSAQSGDALVNSKAVFRALAAGAGVATAPGTVVTGPEQALDAITGLLYRGHSAMVKQELHGGGFGNEILSPVDGVAPAGAQRVVVLPDRPAVAQYLAQRWDWLTGGRGNRLVVERFFPYSRTIYAEFLITDTGADLLGVGELLMEPVAVGAVFPAQSISPQAHDELVDGGLRLCESLRAVGYRGVVSADAILTPGGDVLFTETNCRLTGSTHVHMVLCGQVVDPGYRRRRVFVERAGWPVPSFAAAVDQLARSGLGYAPASRTGVVLTTDQVSGDGTVTYCVVAEDLDAARELERGLGGLFGGP